MSDQDILSELVRVKACSWHVIARFWSKVSVATPDRCWPWTAAATEQGYGKFGISAAEHVYAHRFAWEIANGEILGDRFALHSCDNPACCNPHHLRPGDAKDNARDCISRGRRNPVVKGICPRGHKYTYENTRINVRLDGSKYKSCRECMKQHSRDYRARKANRTQQSVSFGAPVPTAGTPTGGSSAPSTTRPDSAAEGAAGQGEAQR